MPSRPPQRPFQLYFCTTGQVIESLALNKTGGISITNLAPPIGLGLSNSYDAFFIMGVGRAWDSAVVPRLFRMAAIQSVPLALCCGCVYILLCRLVSPMVPVGIPIMGPALEYLQVMGHVYTTLVFTPMGVRKASLVFSTTRPSSSLREGMGGRPSC